MKLCSLTCHEKQSMSLVFLLLKNTLVYQLLLLLLLLLYYCVLFLLNWLIFWVRPDPRKQTFENCWSRSHYRLGTLCPPNNEKAGKMFFRMFSILWVCTLPVRIALTHVSLPSVLFCVDMSGGSIQRSVCAGTRQEAHCSLSELCTQSESDARQVCHLEPIQTWRTDWNLWQLPPWQHCELRFFTFQLSEPVWSLQTLWLADWS